MAIMPSSDSVFGMALRRGPATSEFWVAILSKPVSAIVTFLVTLGVSHAVIPNALVDGLASALTGSVTAAAAGEAAKAYVAGRSAVKTAAIAAHVPGAASLPS